MKKHLLSILLGLGVLNSPAYAIDWAYKTLGENWGGLCQTGKRQSPIDLTPPYYSSPTKVQLSYTNVIDMAELKRNQAMLETEMNTGHSIQINGDAGYFVFGNHRFNVTQFHFHAPSEHTIQGKRYPLEMHIVHKDQLNNIAVVGILFEKSTKENHFIKQLQAEGFPEAGKSKKLTLPMGLNYFDSPAASYLIYDGSFTTPPCTEGVQWIVLTKVYPVSDKQIQNWPTFADAPLGTYRKPQPLNHRVVRSF